MEGFDRRSCFFTYYNHPYYKDHLAALGYAKDVDWIEELITAPTDEAVLQRWEKLSAIMCSSASCHPRGPDPAGLSPLDPQGVPAGKHGYSPLYGTVELSEAQIKSYAGKFAPLINPHLTCFVMNEKEDGGLRRGGAKHRRGPAKAPGPDLPHRLGDLLKAFRKNDTVDLLLIAVRPDLQSKRRSTPWSSAR